MRRLAAEQREKTRTVAALTPGLILHALQLGLLAALRLDIALNLFSLGAVAALDCRQLANEPLADGVGAPGLT